MKHSLLYLPEMISYAEISTLYLGSFQFYVAPVAIFFRSCKIKSGWEQG